MQRKRKAEQEIWPQTQTIRQTSPESIGPQSTKRHRRNLSDVWLPPPAYWDSLSSIPLTKNSLRELQRRLEEKKSSNIECCTEQSIASKANKHKSQYCPPRVSRQGGLDLRELRGYPNPDDNHTMSSKSGQARRKSASSRSTRETNPTKQTSSTKSAGPYDRTFNQHLIDFHILPHAYLYPDNRVTPKPNNWQDIQERLERPRQSLSPSRFTDDDHARYIRADADASKEKQVSETVVTIIEGHIVDGKTRSGGVKFGNLKPLTNGTIVPGNPDVFYGARTEQINLEVRSELGDLIIPSTQYDLPAVPNFMLAAKGPDGTPAVAQRQARYDGALGARGIHALQRYASKDEKNAYDNNAYTISAIYHDGILKMYTSHPIAGDNSDGRPDYVLSQIKVWPLADDADSFRKGATAFRNLRDWAMEQRNAAIDRANAATNVVQSVKSAFSQASGQGSVATSVYTEQSNERELDNNTRTDTASSFAVLGASQSFVKDTGVESDGQSQIPKHSISPPRSDKSKRTRRR